MNTETGKVYTGGQSYRARAEERQRQYRSEVLQVEPAKYGHMLTEVDANAGKNFISDKIHCAAKERRNRGKGVAFRTFNNMLSSQAMCFNLFAPLADDLPLASRVLGKFLPINHVSNIDIEYTPSNDVFGDQSGLGGVDCDVLIIGKDNEGQGILITLETKFVEKEFSICGFRKNKKDREKCPIDINLDLNKSNCLYVSKRKYCYWEQTEKHNILLPSAIGHTKCPFGGSMWQLWVNRVLAAEESSKRTLDKSMFCVLAPLKNEVLLRNNILTNFRQLLREPDCFSFIDLEDILKVIQSEVTSHKRWASELSKRYARI